MARRKKNGQIINSDTDCQRQRASNGPRVSKRQTPLPESGIERVISPLEKKKKQEAITK